MIVTITSRLQKLRYRPKQNEASETGTLRLHSRDPKDRLDLRVDVVPGRYVDEKGGDVFLHQTSGDKNWLKTNLDVHINHIKNSQVTDAIRLIKLWRVRNHLSVRTFVLELLDLLRQF